MAVALRAGERPWRTVPGRRLPGPRAPCRMGPPRRSPRPRHAASPETTGRRGPVPVRWQASRGQRALAAIAVGGCRRAAPAPRQRRGPATEAFEGAGCGIAPGCAGVRVGKAGIVMPRTLPATFKGGLDGDAQERTVGDLAPGRDGEEHTFWEDEPRRPARRAEPPGLRAPGPRMAPRPSLTFSATGLKVARIRHRLGAGAAHARRSWVWYQSPSEPSKRGGVSPTPPGESGTRGARGHRACRVLAEVPRARPGKRAPLMGVHGSTCPSLAAHGERAGRPNPPPRSLTCV